MNALRAATENELITNEQRLAGLKYIQEDATKPNTYFRETIMCSNGNEENENENDIAFLGRDIADIACINRDS